MKTVTALAAFGLALGMMATGTVRADTFGSGNNTFTIDFQTVGNAGNANDAGAGGGNYSSSYGGVAYDFRMGTYEISQDMITKATNLGLANVTAGAHAGNKPAAEISWYEAAAFVNWLNLQVGAHVAYDLTFGGGWFMTLWGPGEQASTGVASGTNPYRHKDAFYVLPSEDEWYKSAYHQNTGVNADYWDYATASNTIPTAVGNGTAAGTAVYDDQIGPADITEAGGLSSYGTMGQNGNVWEWSESAYTAPNDSWFEDRALRGGQWIGGESFLRSSHRTDLDPFGEQTVVGFRVASVPEPSAALLVLMAGGAWLLRRRSSRSL